MGTSDFTPFWGLFYLVMGKENTFYFTHDYNARSDSKIKRLLSKHGCMGYGLYWAIIEDLYNNANVMQLDYESIAYDLRTEESVVKSVINDFDLFVIYDDFFGSNSVQRRLDERDSKSKKASESAQERWRRNADALRAQSDSNAIKESKGKEIKVKEIKINNISERKLEFASTLEMYLPIYGRDFLNDFYFYWTEPNQSNTKFRKELQKTWSLERRLETWAKNDSKFKNNGKPHEKSKTEQIIENSYKAQPIIEDYFKNRNNG